MPQERDIYGVLGVSRTATQDEIKSAYRKLARAHHPDVNKAPDAAKRFAEIQAAYEILSDETKRRNYDQYGTAEPGFGSGGGRPRGTYTWTNVGGRPSGGPGNFSDFDAQSIFEEMFGRSAAEPFGDYAQPRGRTKARPKRGKDIEHDVVLDFIEAARGGAKTIRVNRGSGTQTIEVTIPPGVAQGAKLRMRGLGMPAATTGPAGDLILHVNISPHELFRREGDDVILDLPLTIAEAALGATVRVPTLAGRADVSIPPGSTSGQRLRLRGQGFKTDAGTGDLYVIIKIVAPKDLSAEDQAALRDLAQRLTSPRSGAAWA